MAGLEMVMGPEPPPRLRTSESGSSSKGPEEPQLMKSDDVGRAGKPSTSAIIGPVLPPHLQHLTARTRTEAPDGSEDSGSSSPSSGSEAEVIGPRVEMQGGDYDAGKEFVERQLRAEAAKAEQGEPAREAWMTELPKNRTGVRISGTEARTFLKRDGAEPKLDEGWADTPGQAKRTQDSARAQEDHLARAQRKRDAEIDASLAEYNASKRSKALVDMHQEAKEVKKQKLDRKSKRKKKGKDHKKEKRRRDSSSSRRKDDKRKSRERNGKMKTKHKKRDRSATSSDDDRDEATTQRKPFNWEEDMRVSMVDTTRAKAMLDRTLLQSRFASGKTQKYL